MKDVVGIPECVYNQATGECSTHNRAMNPDWDWCAHMADLIALWTCGAKWLPELLPEATDAVLADFIHQ